MAKSYSTALFLGRNLTEPTQQVWNFNVGHSLTLSKVKVLVAQLCLTLYDPIDCSPPGSSVHAVSQARILEWVAISSSRVSSQLGSEPRSPALQVDFFFFFKTIWATREDFCNSSPTSNPLVGVKSQNVETFCIPNNLTALKLTKCGKISFPHLLSYVSIS